MNGEVVKTEADIVIVGSGPAGLSAATAAKAQGARRVIIIERLPYLGGILPQCIHSGFGARIFDEELTGPAYAAKLIKSAEEAGGEFMTDAFVSEIIPRSSQDPGEIKPSSGSSPHLVARVFSPKNRGITEITSGAIILATGCRERPIGSLSSPAAVTGTRPSGVFTAGTAQRMINLGGYRMGKRAVVLGSGDIGLIVSRRLALTGTEVIAVLEQSKHCGGMVRNRKQCLDAYGIPLLTRHTITMLHGNARLDAVSVAALDDQGTPIPGSEHRIECDTLIVSVGLIPETDLLTDYREKYGETPRNVFVCGNAHKIRNMADDIADDGMRIGMQAAALI
ncbi:MAG: NAD(P)/FAD-dependent oxidoreductase [Clostridiales Family XIII bacterium]|nr:NAD(P)/FAD-dependent oxidoreductase [Clostridiales Family XIII bacterium]